MNDKYPLQDTRLSMPMTSAGERAMCGSILSPAHRRFRRSRGFARGLRGLLLLLPVGGILTCDWITELGNDPPHPVGTIPDQIVEVDSAVTVGLAAYFDDPDGDSLSYDAVSAAPAMAAATVSGGMLTVTGRSKGETRVTVAASDPDGLTATQNFAVTVPNRGPVVVDAIPEGEVFVDGTLMIDLAGYFADPDGDDLAFSATSSDATRATAAVSESTVTVTGMAVGSTTVTVIASDSEGLESAQSFGVTVPNRAPVAVGTIGDRVLEVDSVAILDVAPVFADPDRDSLAYTAASSDPARVEVVVSGSTLTVTGVAKGGVAVTVAARDPGDLEAELGFMVTVPNRAPSAVGAIGDREGDPLEYTAVSSDTTRAVVALSGGVVRLSGVAVGDAEVTVTARDPEGLEAEQAFAVTVPNRAPLPVGTIADRDAFVGDTVTVDVTAYFEEPDGEMLTYAAVSSSATVATVTTSGSTVAVAAVAVGGATVTTLP